MKRKINWNWVALVFVLIASIYCVRNIMIAKSEGVSFINNEKYNITISNDEIIKRCNVSDDFNKLHCLNQIYSENVEYDFNCPKRAYTHTPEQTINIGKGCCKDAVEFYAYFLDKYKIKYKKMTPKNAGHTYLEAYIFEEDKFKGYAIVDANILDIIHTFKTKEDVEEYYKKIGKKWE